MVDMQRSVRVTIKPHITPERASQMVNVIADKLWPGAAGAAQMITKQRIDKQLLLLAYKVAQCQEGIEFRVTRKGLDFTFQPIRKV